MTTTRRTLFTLTGTFAAAHSTARAAGNPVLYLPSDPGANTRLERNPQQHWAAPKGA